MGKRFNTISELMDLVLEDVNGAWLEIGRSIARAIVDSEAKATRSKPKATVKLTIDVKEPIDEYDLNLFIISVTSPSVSGVVEKTRTTAWFNFVTKTEWWFIEDEKSIVLVMGLNFEHYYDVREMDGVELFYR